MPSAVAAAAALALVGRGLRDRLDRQPLHLQPRAVAADARRAGIDHRADARDGQRGLGDVRGEHDAPAAVRAEDALLLGGGQPRVERQDVDVVAQAAVERVGGVADLALAGEEDEHVAVGLAQQPLDRVADRLDRVVVLLDRRVADLDGIGAPGDLDDRRAAEVRGEALGVDRRRGDDHLQVGPLRQDRVQVAEQEVDVQAALVRLVDDDRVVAAQQPVAADLGEQQAVGEQPDERVLARAVGEAHRVADRRAQRARRARRRCARRRCARRAGAAACGRSCRARRGRARGTASAAGWSCPSRSRPRRRRPGGRGSRRAAPRGAR